MTKNYITPQGYQRLKQEVLQLIDIERPKVVQIVSWAASNGDRSENGDYIYGKRRLREIDRRIYFLTQQLDRAEIINPIYQQTNQQIFFGARVTYVDHEHVENTITIVGVDEIDLEKNHVSWISPIAKAFLKAHVGDIVELETPDGLTALKVLHVSYDWN